MCRIFLDPNTCSFGKVAALQAAKEARRLKQQEKESSTSLAPDLYKKDSGFQQYIFVYQRRENLRFYGINENEGKKEDTLKVRNEFLKHKWGVQPGEIELQRVHRVRQTSKDGKHRPIIARF